MIARLRVLADHADGDALLSASNLALAESVGQAGPVAAIEEHVAIEVADDASAPMSSDNGAIGSPLDDARNAPSCVPVERAPPAVSST